MPSLKIDNKEVKSLKIDNKEVKSLTINGKTILLNNFRVMGNDPFGALYKIDSQEQKKLQADSVSFVFKLNNNIYYVKNVFSEEKSYSEIYLTSKEKDSLIATSDSRLNWIYKSLPSAGKIIFGIRENALSETSIILFDGEKLIKELDIPKEWELDDLVLINDYIYYCVEKNIDSQRTLTLFEYSVESKKTVTIYSETIRSLSEIGSTINTIGSAIYFATKSETNQSSRIFYKYFNGGLTKINNENEDISNFYGNIISDGSSLFIPDQKKMAIINNDVISYRDVDWYSMPFKQNCDIYKNELYISSTYIDGTNRYSVVYKLNKNEMIKMLSTNNDLYEMLTLTTFAVIEGE